MGDWPEGHLQPWQRCSSCLPLAAPAKRRPSNGSFPKPAFARVSHVPLCNPLWVTKLLAYKAFGLPCAPPLSCSQHWEGIYGATSQQKSTKGRCCHEHRFAPKHNLQLDQDFLLQTSPRAELWVMQRWKHMASSTMPFPQRRPSYLIIIYFTIISCGGYCRAYLNLPSQLGEIRW